MAQKTNFNVSPYFDDFNSDKEYYKVLFSPGKPIQAREMNNLQSQLQSQIESFGSHIFKDGSMVIPGGVTYDSQFYAVKLNSRQFGVDINIYINNFVGKKIVGDTSKIEAVVSYIAFPTDSDEVEYITLYVKYISANNTGEFSQFTSGETLYATENVTYGNSTISAETTFATVVSENGTAIGSAAHVSKGIYFIRGYFALVEQQTIILDYYTNIPSYKIGLNVNEEIVSAKDDRDLYDNAKGFTNYAAPGADRFKISLTLDKRPLEDLGDPNFIELMRTDEGELKKEETTTQYSLIRDYLAKRTYDESGDYSVEPFTISLNESLNNRIGNDGVFFDDEKTDDGNDPSDSLACIKISPGVAYVGGYDIVKGGATIIDVQKPRTTEKLDNVSVLFKMGNFLRVNNVYGCPTLKGEIDFYNRRKTSPSNFNGTKIGEAKVYSFSLTDAPYTDASTSWDLHLFDLQTYTEITVNQSLNSIQLPESSFVRGKSSGASGYAVTAGSSSVITLTQTSGTFSEGEQIIINGIEDVPRTITNNKVFGIHDIKSVFQSGTVNFVADTILSTRVPPGFSSQDQFNITSSGTVTCPGKFFTGIKIDSIISYTTSSSSPNYNRVSSISADGASMTVVSLTSVSNVCNGAVGVTSTRISLRRPILSAYNSGSLYANLPSRFTSSVDFQNSILTFKAQAISPGTVSGNSLTIDSSNFSLPVGLTTSSFQGFDQERYSIHYTSGGAIETLSSDKFNLDGTSNQITFSNISNGAVDKINGTLVKSGIKSKVKTYNRNKIIDISFSKYPTSGSGISSSTSDGLTYNKYYGLRVHDEEICLNYPDVARVIAVLESLDKDSPILDQLTFSSLANISNNSIVGEKIVGKTSGAAATIVRKPNGLPNNIEFVYLNNDAFILGEIIDFKESSISAPVDSIILGKYKKITNSFILNKSQKTQYYDYSRLVRKSGELEPTKKLLVVFDYYSVPDGDNGDVFTVLSYPKDRYSSDIPLIGPDRVSAADLLDFRPRVIPIDNASSLTKSPFSSSYRSFGTEPNVILSPDEVCILGLEYYVPRIDKLFLDRQGKFIVKSGEPGFNPSAPEKVSNSMELATIVYPPYLSNAKSAVMSIETNRRYTMRDIGNIDNRVTNLERVTSLSLLELNTKSLQITDSDGLNRFKTGFFVDDFKDTTNIDISLSSLEVDGESGQMSSIDNEITLPNLPEYIVKNATTSGSTLGGQPFKGAIPAGAVSLNPGSGNGIPVQTITSKDNKIRFTGNSDGVRSLTLQYDSVFWIDQPIATQVSNVNPYHVIEYRGQVTLLPNNDRWVRTYRQLPDLIIRKTNTLFNTINRTKTSQEFINGSVQMRTASQFDSILTNLRNSGEAFTLIIGSGNNAGSTQLAPNGSQIVQSSTETDISTQSSTSTSTTTESNSVLRLLSVTDEKYMRSRNTQFSAVNLLPHARFYQFLDSQNGIKFIPKILEISKDSLATQAGSLGNFIVGEDVIGYSNNGKEIIRFRIATPNHKEGPHSSPTSTYSNSPYPDRVILPSSYTSSLGYLNVDTYSLSQSESGDYFGYLRSGSRLVGRTSGAVAWVSRLRLFSDSVGDLQGCFFLDDPNQEPAPPIRISTGTKTYKLTNSSTNQEQFPGSNEISSAETSYESTGLLNTVQNETTITTTNIVTTTNITSIKKTTTTTTLQRYDPLAQSFEVGRTAQSPQNSNINPISDRNGAYLTAVDIYFRKVDGWGIDKDGLISTGGNSPVTIEIRTMQLGTPTLTRIGEAVTLTPNSRLPYNGNVLFKNNWSDDASKATTAVFPYPIYLAPDEEYAVVLLAPESVGYEVFIAEMNKDAINANQLGGVAQYSKQFAIGSLFKSQNGSIWTADQNQDMKFTLYKASFTSTGTAFFNNPIINTQSTKNYFGKLSPNSISIIPKKLSIGITTTVIGDAVFGASQLSLGRKVSESGKVYNYGIIDGLGGPASTVGITTGGVNYENTTSAQTFNIVGNGSGLVLNFSTTNGTITTISSVASSGSGYKVGDVVGIVTSSVFSNSGTAAQFTITAVTDYDRIYLTNVQGQSFTTGATLQYFNNSNVRTNTSLSVLSSTQLGSIFSGNYFKVNHFAHGMHSTTNQVEISGVESDIPKVQITATFSPNSTQVSVASTTDFGTFEGVPVSGTNPGYFKLYSEIVSYTGVTNGGLLTGLSRNQDSTISSPNYSYSVGEEIMKYEVGGVSLRRINRTHNISDTRGDLDTYYLEFDRTGTSLLGNNRSSDASLANSPQLSFSREDNVGGNDLVATQNVMFNKIIPSFDVYGPGSNISVSARVRTVTSTSAGGNEVSFIDSGYQSVQLNAINEFITPRMVCSRPNETAYLTELPNSKSFTTAITLSTTDPNLSPQIFLDGSATNFSIPRLDNPVSNYVIDSRANQIEDNSHAARYVSNTIILAQPATSLKVILTAYRHSSADFRVLYNLVSADSYAIQQSFNLFPGYNNLTTDNNQDGYLDIVNPFNNSGLPDSKVSDSQDNQFLEYEYTAPNLEEFIGFTLKIVMSGSIQSRPPIFADIRAIALA